MLTDPAREVVHLSVHDSPAVGRSVVFFDLLDLDLFDCVGICIDGGWGNKTKGDEKRNDHRDEFCFHDLETASSFTSCPLRPVRFE